MGAEAALAPAPVCPSPVHLRPAQVARQEGRIILTSGLPYHKVRAPHLSKGASARPLGHPHPGVLPWG